VELVPVGDGTQTAYCPQNRQCRDSPLAGFTNWRNQAGLLAMPPNEALHPHRQGNRGKSPSA